MVRNKVLYIVAGVLVVGGVVLGVPHGCGKGGIQPEGQNPVNPACPGGQDQDGDGYGEGCPAGADCDDLNAAANPAGLELCDGADNDCDGQVDEELRDCFQIGGPGGDGQIGADPFPIDPVQDPNLIEADGVGLDENGDLVLTRSATSYYFMWIANTKDRTRGTLSKIDTRNMKEVGRYYTTTCHSNGTATDCRDLHGRTIDKTAAHTPSRSAVDFNFDVWVANRAHQPAGGQPSVTKIANDPSDCVDRNNNGTIETSRDLNGDGNIDLNSAEFVGDDDECVLFTVNFDDPGAIGRSVCLQPQKGFRPSHAWVATYNKSTNVFYKIDGDSGALSGPYALPNPHRVYGCAVDSQGILWSVNRNAPEGTLVGLNTRNPDQVTPVLKSPWEPSLFYGIAIGEGDHVWLGGQNSGRTYRYKPDRASFESLGQGTWTGLTEPPGLGATRGIAPDNRGWVWVAGNDGYIWRLDQNIGDGLHDLSGSKDVWQITGTKIPGVGVDLDGHIWANSSTANGVSRLETDNQGNPLIPAGSKTTDFLELGEYPYTYSDFTGFGLKAFISPTGRYRYQLDPCGEEKKASWRQVTWSATTPPGTAVSVRVRSGDSDTTLGQWFGPYQTSPAVLDQSAAIPIEPNPSRLIQVEFLLEKNDEDLSPTLHDFQVAYSCDGPVE